jgi:hypothetical protein
MSPTVHTVLTRYLKDCYGNIYQEKNCYRFLRFAFASEMNDDSGGAKDRCSSYSYESR